MTRKNMLSRIVGLLCVLSVAAHAAPAKPVAKSPAKTAVKSASKPRQHSKTIKRLEAILGRKLSVVEKAKVRAARDVYDRDLARAVGLTAEQLRAKDKAYKAAHKNEDKGDRTP